MPSFSRADRETVAHVQAVAKLFHPQIAGRFRLAVVMVEPISGAAVPAIEVKPNGPRSRASGAADATVYIDREGWELRSAERRNALVDHGLAALAPVVRDGRLSTDVAGRPRLKRRKPDTVCGYEECWARWGEASYEAERFAEAAARKRGRRKAKA